MAVKWWKTYDRGVTLHHSESIFPQIMQNQLSLAPCFHMAVNMMLNSCRTDEASTAKWLQYLLATNTDPADTLPGTPFWVRTQGKLMFASLVMVPCVIWYLMLVIKLSMILWLCKCNLLDMVSVLFWIVFPKIHFHPELQKGTIRDWIFLPNSYVETLPPPHTKMVLRGNKS